MNNRILLVDDEQNLLDGLKRGLRGKFKIETATSGSEGLKLIEEKGPFAVIVSDYKMPEMNGVKFLLEAMKKSPDSVRIMLTGQADIDAAIDVINRARIFRFLSKPCPADILADNIDDGMEQFRLKHAEKELIEKTLSGSIKVLTDVLCLVSPMAFSKALRVRKLVKQLLDKIKIENPWQVEIASMLSQIGCVTVPDAILRKAYNNETLLSVEKRIFNKHPIIGANMLVNIPRLEKISEIISYHEKLYNGTGLPADDKKKNEIPVGARILKIVIDYDTLVNSGVNQLSAFQIMNSRESAGWYDPAILNVFHTMMRKEKEKIIKEVTLSQLREGMILADIIETEDNVLIANRGQEVSASLLEKLKNIGEKIYIREPVKVLELKSNSDQ